MKLLNNVIFGSVVTLTSCSIDHEGLAKALAIVEQTRDAFKTSYCKNEILITGHIKSAGGRHSGSFECILKDSTLNESRIAEKLIADKWVRYVLPNNETPKYYFCHQDMPVSLGFAITRETELGFSLSYRISICSVSSQRRAQ